MSSHSTQVTWEVETANGEDIIQVNEICISFTASRYYAATRQDPAEGGEVEFVSAEVLGNRGLWITLQPTDPAFIWAVAYFDEHHNDLSELAQAERLDMANEAREYAYDRYRDC